MKEAAQIKENLLQMIEEIGKEYRNYVRNPDTDFSRVKKWSFTDIMRFILMMEGKALQAELLNFFDFSPDTPTNSSFNQRRAQILPAAFEALFRQFTQATCSGKYFRGYRLLACDGSNLGIAHNPEDKTTYRQSCPGTKGYNELHLNALYDLMAQTYTDAVIQPVRMMNEHKAMCEMVDRYQGDVKTIFLADRGFECYNVFAHVQEKGMYYLIRAKDVTKQGIIAASKALLPCCHGAFDTSVGLILTRQHKKKSLFNPAVYRKVTTTQTFDYLDPDTRPFYEMNFRVVRFPITENTFECIITNLPREEFSSEDIKDLYHMRWGIETSFRELKYAVGLTHFHAKKVEYIKQEIWARLLLYNFCMTLTLRTALRKSHKKNKHVYQLNYTRAIYICRYFLSLKEKAPPDIDLLISKELLPVRPGRSDPRKVKFQSAVSFLYRVA